MGCCSPGNACVSVRWAGGWSSIYDDGDDDGAGCDDEGDVKDAADVILVYSGLIRCHLKQWTFLTYRFCICARACLCGYMCMCAHACMHVCMHEHLYLYVCIARLPVHAYMTIQPWPENTCIINTGHELSAFLCLGRTPEEGATKDWAQTGGLCKLVLSHTPVNKK